MVNEKDDNQRKKKESIVDLSKFLDKKVRVKFQGGREGLIIRPFLCTILIFQRLGCSRDMISC